MEENQINLDYGKALHSWQVPEFDKHLRPKLWYISAAGIAIVLLIFSLITANFLFAVIIIIAALIIILHDSKEPDKVDFSIFNEGVMIGNRFFDYDEIKHFAVVFKPSKNIKNLYFEFKGVIRPRLSIPLLAMDPLQIRETLLKYLKEDLERTDQPVSEAMAKFFRL